MLYLILYSDVALLLFASLAILPDLTRASLLLYNLGGIAKLLCKAVWLLVLFSLIVNMSRGNILHVWGVL